jgi:anthranilate phosphoribosyltransferase
VRDVVLFNAAAAIASYDGHETLRPETLSDAISAGLIEAARAIDSGAAAALLAKWVDASQTARSL